MLNTRFCRLTSGQYCLALTQRYYSMPVRFTYKRSGLALRLQALRFTYRHAAFSTSLQVLRKAGYTPIVTLGGK